MPFLIIKQKLHTHSIIKESVEELTHTCLFDSCKVKCI